MEQLVAETFARALASKDSAALRELIAPSLDFVGMTPSRVIMGKSADDLIHVLFDDWFAPHDEIEAIDQLDAETFADRQRVGYRLLVQGRDGKYLVDQTAYLSLNEGRISWLRVMCAGYRRADI